jgi:protein-S-isoprenylcysteine O-methyltransferase Ste14
MGSTGSGRLPRDDGGVEAMSTAYLVFVGLYLAGLVIRDGYELLKKAGRVDTRDSRVFATVFTSMCVMWVSWFGLGLLAPTRLPVPDALRWTGLGAVILGFVLAVGGMWQLKGVENIDHLVTAGLFSRIRHPMYVGFILWILGWSAYRGAPASLVGGLLGLLSIVWWRRLEEGELQSRYGQAYAQYRARTWF